MVRDRLAELKAKAQNYEDKNEVTIIIPNNEETFMKKFFQDVSEIEDYLNEIKRNIKAVERNHNNIIFSDPEKEKKIKAELDELMDSIRRLSNKTRAKLKLMEQDIEDEKSNTVTTEFRIRQAQLNALTRQLVDIMSDFNQIQIEYKKKCEDRIKKQLKITGQEITDEQLQDMLEQENPAIFIKDIVMETKKAQETLDDINARHADIMKLERNIKELHEMFMDMAMIIENQGEIIDRIEFNVQNTVEYTEKAKNEIVQALELQKKSRKLKIIIIVVVLVIIIVIAVPVAVQSS
ncbi:syntaxin-like [Centruroides vittatus]|uniref:syntaxin-like n=1 Tax=Centruroides vittatus TaxID=120091 RepID=UPI00350F0471